MKLRNVFLWALASVSAASALSHTQTNASASSSRLSVRDRIGGARLEKRRAMSAAETAIYRDYNIDTCYAGRTNDGKTFRTDNATDASVLPGLEQYVKDQVARAATTPIDLRKSECERVCFKTSEVIVCNSYENSSITILSWSEIVTAADVLQQNCQFADGITMMTGGVVSTPAYEVIIRKRQDTCTDAVLTLDKLREEEGQGKEKNE